MSVNMFLPNANEQYTNIKSICENISRNFKALKKSILNFVNETELKGKAYDSAKQYFNNTYIPLIDSFILLSNAIIKANNQFIEDYKSQVDVNSLQSEVLENQIQRLQIIISELERISAYNSTVNFSCEHMLYCYRLQQRKIKEKLELLLSYNGSSVEIFSEVEDLLNNIKKGIAEVSNNSSWETSSNVLILNNANSLNNSSSDSGFDKWIDKVQMALDGLGLIPVIGEIADGINGVIYLSKGDILNAGISFISMIPEIGDTAKGARYLDKASDLLKYTDKAVDLEKSSKKISKATKNLDIKDIDFKIDSKKINSKTKSNIIDSSKDEMVTYRRVQGGTGDKKSQPRVVIDNDGNVYISNKKAKLNVSIDNGEHSQYYVKNKRPGADIYEFDVPKWFDDMVNEYTIPQEGYKKNPLNQGGTVPSLNDISTPGKCIEFPAPWIEWIEEYASNGRIIKGGK